jgi:hypothetical protein
VAGKELGNAAVYAAGAADNNDGFVRKIEKVFHYVASYW